MTLRFSLARAMDVRLRVYDITGREVVTLADGARGAGEHVVRWDARGVASGAYLCHRTQVRVS